MKITLEVNGILLEAEKGETILTVLRRNGLSVPTICNLKDLSPSGACRMCVVEVEGRENLVPACSFPVEGPLKIMTHSPRVLKARKTNVELLLSSHPDDCLYCERNGTCELQKMAEDLHIRERRIPGKKSPHKIDKSSPAIVRDPAKCILCGRCVRVCEEIMATSTLDFAHRGNELRISTTMAKPINYSNCTACGQCVIACPTGALLEHVQFPELEAHLRSPDKLLVAQYTPAVAVSVAESLGVRPGTDMSGIIHAALRRYGFDYVFGSCFGADLMMIEQARIFSGWNRGENGMPLITSSCPAWVQYAEQYYPWLLENLSPLKSPHQIMGTLIRKSSGQIQTAPGKEIVSVLITSCTAAKSEARRAEMTLEGVPVIDMVLTTRELARLIRLSGLDLDHLEPEPSDAPFSSECTAGKLTGAAGGEMEGTMRAVYHEVTGRELAPARLHRYRIHRSFREMTVKAGEREIRIGTVSGLANTVELIEEIRSGKRKLDVLEVMACPDGCANGGGQPLPMDEGMVRTRTKAIYDLDNGKKLHSVHQDPVIMKLYEDRLGEPGSDISKKWFRTGHAVHEKI